MFRRRSAGATDGTAQDSPGAQSPDGPADAKQPRPAAEAGKGRPTPKRSEAERGRYQPITKSGAASRGGSGAGSRGGSGAGSRGGSRPGTAAPRTPEGKQRARADRSRRYEAMKEGQEWALNPKDRGPVRALARDYIDSKRRVSEYYMYILLVLVAALFFRSKTAQEFISPLILVLVFIIVVDAQLIKRALAKLIAERLPGESTRGPKTSYGRVSSRGLTLYAVMRALQIRRFRIPAPRVHPGDKI